MFSGPPKAAPVARKRWLSVALLLPAVSAAGRFGPEEAPATEVEEEETTPGEETVEAGGQPTGEPVNDTANAGETETDASGDEETAGEESEGNGTGE